MKKETKARPIDDLSGLPCDFTTPLEEEMNKQKPAKAKTIFKLFGFVFSSAKFMCTLILALSIMLSLLRPVLATLWGKYIDAANNYSPETGILAMAGMILGYFALNYLCTLLNRYLYQYEQIERVDVVQANRFQEKLDARLYRKLASLSPEYLEIAKTNDLIERVFKFTTEGWSGLNRLVMMNGYSIIARTVSVITIAATLYIFSPWLCLLILIAPIPTLYTTYVDSKLSFKFLKDNSELARKGNYLQNIMLNAGAKEMRTLDLFDFFFGKWKKAADEYTILERKKQFRSSALGAIRNTISALTLSAAYVLAIVLMTTGRITLGALGSVMSLIQTLVSDTSALFSALGKFMSNINEAAMFFELMELPSQTQQGEKTGEITEIKANNLRYRYPMTDKYVLDGVNLEIKRGEKIALVGENGAGKSTFVKLLCGMIEPSEGILSVNSIDSRKLAPEATYNRMSAVFQDPAKYTTFTVADNVFLGDTKRERDDGQITDCLKKAGCPELESELALGKDVGGTDLSGGQWQKLAIARAYYRDRDFILLDEPTGNLDPLAEAEIFKRYTEMSRDKTVVFVTHRISIAALADRVVVFGDGKITESGTHEELLANNGEYAKLYHEQAKWYDR